MSKQKDKTCVPVVPQATEEQRETLRRKAIGKHKETKIEYELMLMQNGSNLVVDLRKDIVDSDGEIASAEYIEGFIFDHWNEKKAYAEAVTKLLELKEKYPSAYISDEILEDSEAFLAIRYGNGSWEVGA